MRVCWEERGCDEEMESYCPHAFASDDGVCPAECNYTFCTREQHVRATSIDLLLDATVDRTAAVKESCRFCEFFLKNGPRLAQ